MRMNSLLPSLQHHGYFPGDKRTRIMYKVKGVVVGIDIFCKDSDIMLECFKLIQSGFRWYFVNHTQVCGLMVRASWAWSGGCGFEIQLTHAKDFENGIYYLLVRCLKFIHIVVLTFQRASKLRKFWCFLKHKFFFMSIKHFFRIRINK